MKKKIVDIFVCTLLITAIVLPASAVINNTQSNIIIENNLLKNNIKKTSNPLLLGTDSGGIQQGVHIRQKGKVHQNKYDEATDLHFKIWQKEDNIDVNGWSVTISGFPNVNSQRSSQPPPYTNQVDNHPDVRPFTNNPDNNQHAIDVDADGASIPYCTEITIEWDWWLTHKNKKQVADFKWTKDGDENKAAPNHGWNIDPPEQDPDNPSKYFHRFTLMNDDDETITFCNLSFLATMEWYDNLTEINFPTPYDCFTLEPGDEYVHNINTTGPLYGGHIYFKYEILEGSQKFEADTVFKDVADHPITDDTGIVRLEPEVLSPWPTWTTIDEGLDCTIKYSSLYSMDPAIVITPSYITLNEYIDISHLTWKDTEDLMWTPLDSIVIIPGYPVSYFIPMNYGDIAALLRFEVALEDNPGYILENFITETILDGPWPEISGINNEFINFAIRNFHNVPVDTLDFDFIGSILPDAIEDWYDPDPPGEPYLYEDTWYGGWGCPPEIQGSDIEFGIDMKWIDIYTEIQPDQWVYFGLSLDPSALMLAIPDACWGDYRENTLPDKPDKPSGSTSGNPGTSYSYTTKTIDLDEDELHYMWDWGDKTVSEWSSPYPSGQEITLSHTWTEKGDYEIRVKALDANGYESDWSDYLTVTITKSRNKEIQTIFLQFLYKFLESYPNLSPFIQKLLNKIGE